MSLSVVVKCAAFSFFFALIMFFICYVLSYLFIVFFSAILQLIKQYGAKLCFQLTVVKRVCAS